MPDLSQLNVTFSSLSWVVAILYSAIAFTAAATLPNNESKIAIVMIRPNGMENGRKEN